MSRGQKRRTPQHFPRMRYRAWKRQIVYIGLPYGPADALLGRLLWPVQRRKVAEFVRVAQAKGLLT